MPFSPDHRGLRNLDRSPGLLLEAQRLIRVVDG